MSETIEEEEIKGQRGEQGTSEVTAGRMDGILLEKNTAVRTATEQKKGTRRR